MFCATGGGDQTLHQNFLLKHSQFYIGFRKRVPLALPPLPRALNYPTGPVRAQIAPGETTDIALVCVRPSVPYVEPKENVFCEPTLQTG